MYVANVDMWSTHTSHNTSHLEAKSGINLRLEKGEHPLQHSVSKTAGFSGILN